MPDSDKKQRSYMALAPLASLAGIFISPIASTAPPLILFFIFNNRRPMVAKVALQTADLAFSIQLWIMLISLVLGLGISLAWINANDAKEMMGMATIIILGIFVISLFFAIYQAINGRSCSHLFSFKIAERVLNLVNKKDKEQENDK